VEPAVLHDDLKYPLTQIWHLAASAVKH
jgi:hypothetical protein